MKNMDSKMSFLNLFLYVESKYPLKVCWLCGATKGLSGDLSLCFTDVSPGARWWHTVGRSPPPWQITPKDLTYP